MAEKTSVTVAMPICTSCHRIIARGTEPTKFPCPNCGEIVIWRCSRCRKFGRPYRCPKCSFQGP
ncbi:MAG: zinc finger domain-containing protein [Candidatus Bathyarchaeia archaeon]